MTEKFLKIVEKIFEKEKQKLEKSQNENMPGDDDWFEINSRLSELAVLHSKIMKKFKKRR